MRKLFFLFLLLPFLAIGQKLGAKVIEFDSITSTVRDTYSVPYGKYWLIFNGTTGQFEYTDGSETWQPLGVGSGDVTGPASSTDNAIARFDSTTGKIIQNSGVTINDAGDLDMNLGEIINADALDVNGISLNNGSILQVNKIEFSLDGLTPPNSEGQLTWNAIDNELEVFDGSSLRDLAYQDELATAGSDDQTASEVPITATGFSGNLDTGITNVQLLAEAVDTLTISGLSEYRNPEVLYVARTSGDVTNEWAETSGQEGKKVINYCASGNCYYNVPSGLTTLQSILASPMVAPSANMIFTSDNFTIRGNGTQYVSISPNPASGFVGVYVDSANVVNFSRNNILTAHTFWGGYFKPYSISQVTGLASSNIAETSFDIDWDSATASVGTISDYQYSIDGGTPVDVTGATGATVSGLTASTTYNVNVRAVDAGGNVGQYSADLEVTTSSGSAIATSAPLYDFNAESLSTGALTTWANAGSGTADATTDQGSPTVVDESGKKAVSFDGNDNLSLGTPADLDFTIGTSDFTVMIVWGATSGTAGSIFSDRDTDRNFNIAVTAADNTLVQIGSSGQFFDTGLTKAAGWVYEVSVDASVVNSYVEGVIDTSGGTASGEVAQNEIMIGSRADNTNYFNGTIRRILVWNRLLTTGERADIYDEVQITN